MDCCSSGICALLGRSSSNPRERTEKLLRRALPELANGELRFTQITDQGTSASSSASTEVVFRIDVLEGTRRGEVLQARFMSEEDCSCGTNLCRRIRTTRYGCEPLYKRNQDAAHMRQLLDGARLAPRALVNEKRLAVDTFMEGDCLKPAEACTWSTATWERLGALLARIHTSPTDGFQVQAPMWPDRLKWLAAMLQADGLRPPMHELEDLWDYWPRQGAAAALVPSHGEFTGGSIIQLGDQLLVSKCSSSGLNYAGVDASYAFCQALLAQGSSEQVMDGGEPNWRDYPSLQQRESFAKAYLKGVDRTSDQTVSSFLLDVERFSPAVLGLWAGMTLARTPQHTKGAKWYLMGYRSACQALQARSREVLQQGVWATACASSGQANR